jgi:hypothetical protein
MSSSDGRKARFSRFYKRVGEADFAPDFLDSLVRVVANGRRDMSERVLAWSKYRAWGNQNEYAIHIYSRNGEAPEEITLGQRDCALDLAWLEAGHRVEWLDAPRKLFMAETERLGIQTTAKSWISTAFRKNEQA